MTHAPFFHSMVEAANAAVAAIPERPVTSTEFPITAPLPPAELVSLVESAIGTFVLTAPSGATHVHSPHCDQLFPSAGASLPTVAVHASPAATEHGEPSVGSLRLVVAAKAGDLSGVNAALASGESIHQRDEVRGLSGSD